MSGIKNLKIPMCKSCDEKAHQPNQPPNPKEENISEECDFQGRICNTCNGNKSINDFPKDRNRFRLECKDCYAKKVRHIRKNKKTILVNLMGGVCVDCMVKSDDSNMAIFDFHHEDPNIKDFHDFTERSLAVSIEEIKKCVLLCANCHKKRHSKGFNSIEESQRKKHRVGIFKFKRKEKIIKHLGSVCIKCNTVYNGDNYAIFETHHLDPTQKEFSDFANKKWEIVESEIEKCVLLCANCHRLEHSKY